MPGLIDDQRCKDALDVSAAFDNCFFHTYLCHLLANKLPLPDDLFTFTSLLGVKSHASKLQGIFPKVESLSLFEEFSQYFANSLPIDPHYTVEKTLVLGILIREYLATELSKIEEIKHNMCVSVIILFNTFKNFREIPVPVEELLSGPEGVLYTANSAFLDYFTARNLAMPAVTEEKKRFEQYFINAGADVDKALQAFWEVEGYQNYCRELAKPQTKLSPGDVNKLLKGTNHPYKIYDLSDGMILGNSEPAGERAHPVPEMEVILAVKPAHYKLLKTVETTSFLEHYRLSFENYQKERNLILTKQLPLPSTLSSSLLVEGIISAEGFDPFNLMIEKLRMLEEKIKKLKETWEAFQNTIKSIEEKKDGLNVETADYIELDTLCTTLKDEGKKFFNPGIKVTPETYNAYQTNCKEAFKRAHEHFNSPEIKQILLNVFAAIIGLGIVYAIAAGLNLYANNWKKFTLFASTSNINGRIDQAEENLNKALEISKPFADG